VSVQKAAGCIIGEDYPKRIVKHEEIMPINLKKMNAAYAKDKDGSSKRKGDDKDTPPSSKKKK
jgi:cryptochrome